jgi:hypothetical protein
VADSFQGFPVPDGETPRADRELEADMRRIDFLAPGVETVTEYFARFGVVRGVSLVSGFFEQTMDGLRGRRWSLVRLDADTYHATRLTLESLYPGLAAGGYLIVDDYFHPYLPESCRKAVDDFRAEHSIVEPIEQIDWNAARWRKRSEPEPLRDRPVAQPETLAAQTPGKVRASQIPTDRELQLQDEVADLEARLRSAHAELERLSGPPLARLRRRVRGQ